MRGLHDAAMIQPSAMNQKKTAAIGSNRIRASLKSCIALFSRGVFQQPSLVWFSVLPLFSQRSKHLHSFCIGHSKDFLYWTPYIFFCIFKCVLQKLQTKIKQGGIPNRTGGKKELHLHQPVHAHLTEVALHTAIKPTTSTETSTPKA